MVGGVLDCSGTYIADSALLAEHLMEGAYDFKEASIKYINEDVIYLGLFIKQWGHFLLDFMSRLWFLVGKKLDEMKFVYISFTGEPIDGNYQELLELFGIRNEQLILINKPFKFKSVVVGQTSYLRPFSYTNEYRFVFQQIIDNLNKEKISYPNFNKIFWTRRKFKDAKKKEFGEENIEKLFKKNGYKVLAPEKIPLKEQIYYFHTCKKMAAISGTIPHNLLFSSSETELLILNRTYRINVNQFPINELVGAKVIYIDCHYSFFPNSADKGPYLLGVNHHLLDYCTDNLWEIPRCIQDKVGKIRIIDYIKYSIAYFNTYSGKETVKMDAGMAGCITGYSRPRFEKTVPHEIYYYYRNQVSSLNDINELEKHLKQYIKKKILKR